MLKKTLFLLAIILIAQSFVYSNLEFDYIDFDEPQQILYQTPVDALEIDLHRGFIPNDENQGLNKIKRQTRDFSDLPTNFTWQNFNGTNYLTLVQNQKLPQYCSSSWAFAAASSLSDRIKIKRKAAWPDIVIGVQQLLSCQTKSLGCEGGDDLDAYSYIYENEIPDQTCSIYQGSSWLQGVTCTDFNKCGTCWGALKQIYIYQILQYNQIIQRLLSSR
ncbi:hypothetical protein PPERSA_08399 [Pseudocohnilembus persalinus]|uniref:Peptidase C1A papain C-terminal domain-containing protein n=1 Tax=Pseudocohnilembus persalinus TaxID=266149 RepID=A0A0V0QAL6_PSEPJ|nr:hypothetical protein PPERSA_08399 [Pseudocohnilembus persalinus]|eukprot:KRW99273.1 hypothetical protein PPERSA_08399 [Pseudocohnilembus persalinus]